MKIPVIKKLIDELDLKTLNRSAEELEEEKPLSIEIDGDDDGEKLTHIYGAIWILEQVEKGTEKNMALREFSARVRNSIN
jgi:Family of unknown function (DUF6952)